MEFDKLYSLNNQFEKEKPYGPQVDLPHEHKDQWNPYVFNAGTVVGVGGKGFVLVAGDTRLSKGYGIVSRDTSKIAQLTEDNFLATSGMYADFTALKKNLQAQLQMYEYNNHVQPSSSSVACLLARTLYYKRFFPYYTFNILAGFDQNDNGIVYGYDAVGSYDTKNYIVQGSGQSEMMPILDNMMEGYNKIKQTFDQNNLEDLVNLIVDVFNSTAERDIFTGDQIEMMIKRKGQPIERRMFSLRKD